jgi:hypothetical protein
VRGLFRAGLKCPVLFLALCTCFALVTTGCSVTTNNGNCDAQGGGNSVSCGQRGNSSSPVSPRQSSPPVAPSTPPPSTRHALSPAYLTGLNYGAGGAFEGGLGQNVNVGVALIDGKKYSDSFYESICVNTPIDVAIPSGYSKIVGTAGYSDDSSNKSGVTLQIQATTDPSDSTDPNWIRIDLIPLTSQQGVTFSDPLPAGTTAIQLSATSYACATEIVWGNPAVK